MSKKSYPSDPDATQPLPSKRPAPQPPGAAPQSTGQAPASAPSSSHDWEPVIDPSRFMQPEELLDETPPDPTVFDETQIAPSIEHLQSIPDPLARTQNLPSSQSTAPQGNDYAAPQPHQGTKVTDETVPLQDFESWAARAQITNPPPEFFESTNEPASRAAAASGAAESIPADYPPGTVNPVKDENGRVAGEMKPKNKKLPFLIGGCVIAVFVLVFLITKLLGGNSSTISVRNFTNLAFSGLNGSGTVAATIDQNGLVEKYVRQDDKNGPAIAQFLSTIQVSVGPTEGLSNNDTLTVSYTYDVEAAKKSGCTIAEESYTTTVKDLLNPDDLFSGLKVGFQGSSPFGTAIFDKSGASEYVQKNIYFYRSTDGGKTATKDTTLTNGETITIYAADIAGGSPLAQKDYTVSGMDEYIQSMDGVDMSSLTKNIDTEISSLVKSLGNQMRILSYVEQARYLSCLNSAPAISPVNQYVVLYQLNIDGESPRYATVSLVDLVRKADGSLVYGSIDSTWKQSKADLLSLAVNDDSARYTLTQVSKELGKEISTGLQSQAASEGNNGSEPNPTIPTGKYGDYIFQDSDKRLLTDADLAGKDSTELYIARNEIYARHGNIFTSGGSLDKYFRTKSWYTPTEDVTDNDLTDIELENVDKIRDAESEL